MSPLRPLALCIPFLLGAPVPEGSGFERALAAAEAALGKGDLDQARSQIDRALERDPNALAAWDCLARWAEQKDDKDELVHALHRTLSLGRAQKQDRKTLEALRARLSTLDPVAEKLLALRANFVDKLVKLGEGYEKGKRPHSAIRAFHEALALDPDRADIQAAIERVAAAPDPSLAEDARARDLLEGISEQWIDEHDAEHSTWSERARLERPNYITETDAGYAVLVRAAEAMEQMNAFYRRFFRYGYGEDKRSPSRIALRIFKSREEYLKLGEGPPVEWSGGHFTGSAVETYIGSGGFEETTGTLFHEAAHQFVSLATNAAGWLNEGLASFFEGSRILANGTVIMNLPANHRLFPLVERMEKGWMASAQDGIDPADSNKEPSTAPTFRIVLEDEYKWGPAWYAPTWGVVYFLYNYQDPSDGRFLYRKAFHDYVDKSGGKTGKGAIETFEEVVLGNPAPVTEGQFTSSVPPGTVDELNGVWKNYLLALADLQTGRTKDTPRYREWAQNARKRGDLEDALEFYERALAGAPPEAQLLIDFAECLAEHKNEDRATKLLHQAAAVIESAEEPDEALLRHVEQRLRKLDPQYQRLDDVRAALLADATGIVKRYLGAGLNLMAMEVSYDLGNALQAPELFASYEQAVRLEGRSLARWKLAYDEQSLKGWNATGFEEIFQANGEAIDVRFGEYEGGATDYAFLTLDEVTTGDFSVEAEVLARYGHVAFAGLVFGRKSASDFHGLVLFPPPAGRNGFANLASFYGGSSHETWLRTPVQHPFTPVLDPAKTYSEGDPTWFRLRIDVTGRFVDAWVNGQYATKEFPSLDVLRGSFGLIVGRGEARFRNVRYLARNARDPSAPIERKLRLVRTAGSETESVNGSWVGLVPPFPEVKTWLQDPRTSWEEAVGAPQLLVLWSCQQNDLVEIAPWLRSLAKQQESIGLRVVSVVQGWDEGLLPEYLPKNPFPGSLAVDSIEGRQGLGATFARYQIDRFHLPRLLLIDVDGKVAWEGDPGFSRDRPWSGEESLLDAPLRELVAKRRLTELAAWRARWPEAKKALAAADFSAAAPVLKEGATFDPRSSPEVAEAAGALAALEEALVSPESTAAALAEQGREPALEVLLQWAEQAGTPVKETKVLKNTLKGENLATWKRVPGILRPVLGRLNAGREAGNLQEPFTKIEALPGAFPAEILEELRVAASDPAALKKAIEEAATLPARWLASEYFHW